ncbi:SHOCT domain-containing protein [Streptomyces sp. NPDC020807]|uniref:SHOCT domain-containing protein n=1 Tax=Streptomyces sp. NPDC020807 TaxID=3155119 RepID=UPI00340CCFCB
MNTRASAGPGPWVRFVPLVWAAVVFGLVRLARRAGWRGRGGRAFRGEGPDERSPIALLGHRFAAGEIDEDEYWRRLTVLEEQFGRAGVNRGKK